MPTVTVAVPRYDPKTGRPKMVLQGVNGSSYAVPWAPRKITHSNLGEDVQTVDRPGRKPDLAVTGLKLRNMTIDFIVGRDYLVSCEPELSEIERMVNAGGAITVLYGLKETGIWKVNDFSWASIEREPQQNQVSRAEVSISLIEVPDSRAVVGQESISFNYRSDEEYAAVAARLQKTALTTMPRSTANGVGVLTGSPAQTTQVANTTTSARVAARTPIPPVVVKEMDTLLSIAQQHYGPMAEAFWRVVGDVNKVIGPLRIGQVLRLP